MGLLAFPAASILDSTAIGRAVLTANDAPSVVSLLGLDVGGQEITTDGGVSGGNLYSYLPDGEVDAESTSFNITTRSFENSNATFNYVTRFGYNVAPGGGPVDSAKAMVGRSTEARYYYTAGGYYVSEVHDEFQRPSGTIQRYISAFLGHAAPTRANNNLALNIEQVFHADTAGNLIWTSDRTEGFWIRDCRLALTNAGAPSADLLVMDGSPTMSGYFFRVKKNGTSFFQMNQHGEVVLDGSSVAISGGNSGAVAFFDVIGHAGNEFTATFRDSSGTSRLSVSRDGTYAIINPTTLYARTSVYVQNGSSVTQFAALSDGQLWTNQASAGGPAGAVTHKMPWYDNTGGLIGYVELKALS